MARKVFGSSLKNAMEQNVSLDRLEEMAAPSKTSPTVARAQASVIEEDKHATRLLDPALVRMSAVMDRIDPSDGLDELVDSIREHGQKVAVLVRKIPGGGYEIVYGRRRLLACRALGQKVRASVMEMTDEEAIMAQGIENNARKDPSFIERALFVAGIIRELGRTEDTRKNAQTVAYRALQIDESLVSRMNRIAQGIPVDLIRAIGPAHGSGRRAWETLAKLCEANPDLAVAIIPQVPQNATGGERLDAAIGLLSLPSLPRADQAAVRDSGPVRMMRKGNRLTVEADPTLLPAIENAIRRAIKELLDRGQDGGPDGDGKPAGA